jgi:hypothetical protein
MRVKFLYCILTVSSALQAGDVTTEIKRKLEKKEKKRKKRESKLHEEVNGGANGTAEIKVMTSALLCFVLACLIWDLAIHLVLSQYTACHIKMTPNHWLVPSSGPNH